MNLGLHQNCEHGKALVIYPTKARRARVRTNLSYLGDNKLFIIQNYLPYVASQGKMRR